MGKNDSNHPDRSGHIDRLMSAVSNLETGSLRMLAELAEGLAAADVDADAGAGLNECQAFRLLTAREFEKEMGRVMEECRKRQKITFRRLAKLVGHSPEALSSMEKGMASPGLVMALRVAAVLGGDMERFFRRALVGLRGGVAAPRGGGR